MRLLGIAMGWCDDNSFYLDGRELKERLDEYRSKGFDLPGLQPFLMYLEERDVDDYIGDLSEEQRDEYDALENRCHWAFARGGWTDYPGPNNLVGSFWVTKETPTDDADQSWLENHAKPYAKVILCRYFDLSSE